MSEPAAGVPRLRVVRPSYAQVAAGGETQFQAIFGDPAVIDACPEAFVRRGSAGRYATGSAEALSGLAALLGARGFTAVAVALERALQPVSIWQLRTRSLTLAPGIVMGIVNLTDDSFSGDGVGTATSAALRRAEELRAQGADVIDVGAETARADRPVIPAEEEARSVAPVVAALSREGHVVSIDSYKPLTVRVALESGAEIVNDISGLTIGPGAAEEAARAGAAYVLNYSYSPPKQRPDAPPQYTDVTATTLAWMEQRLAALAALGLAERVAIDPGIAFGKSHDEDIQSIRRIGELCTPGRPVLLAHSRKNFIGSIGGRVPVDRDLETHVVTALAFAEGARIFRVHDVAGTRRALGMAAAITRAQAGDFAPDSESWPWRAGATAAHMTTAAPVVAPPAGQRW